ncbi:MAG: hypothetical protein PF484_09215 [Bacteroidales bacterium]|jgi:hypothetical protein|nr:hypothetical protein [Bacteroidales bacterium]
MKTDMIILGIASVWGLYHTLRNKHILSGLVTLGLIGGIILAFLRLNDSSFLGILVFIISASIALLYTLFYKNFSPAKRIIIALTILPTVMYWIFLVNHFQGAEWLWYSLFLPFIAIIYGIMRPVYLKNEWGFIIILLAEAFTHIYPVLLNQRIL